MSYYKKIIGEKCYLSPESQCSMDKTFSIVDINTNKALGMVKLTDINQLYQNCSLKLIILNENKWIDNLGVEAVKLVLDLAFNFLNLHSITISLASTDLQSIDCYKEAGFKEIGTRRKSTLINGQLEDELLMDILSNEYTSIYIRKELERMVSYKV